MKKFALISAVLLLFIGTIFYSCNKQQIIEESKNEILTENFDSVGYFYNQLCELTLKKIGNKKNISTEELYEITKKAFLENNEILESDIPNYNDVNNLISIISDTSLNIIDKYKIIKPDYSISELYYINQIDSLFKITKNDVIQELNIVEVNIENDTNLSDNQKNSLLMFYDVAEHSYILWKEQLKTKEKPNDFWTIVWFDAGGALAGAYFGWPGAIFVGTVSSITASQF